MARPVSALEILLPGNMVSELRVALGAGIVGVLLRVADSAGLCD